MVTEHLSPVSYKMRVENELIDLNVLIGTELKIRHTGRILCINCDRVTRKSFAQGYCYNCFCKLAETDTCIMSPEKCHFDQGTCRDPEWAQSHCMQPHVVYLANTSGLKVGITRGDQVPVRWMDQGATEALPIAVVSERKLAGIVEDQLREHVSDRTQWQRMLKGEAPEIDLDQQWQSLQRLAASELDSISESYSEEDISFKDTTPEQALAFTYPLDDPPAKVKAMNLDKTPEVAGVLTGIKGQYLIFETGVLNVRKFTGYEVEVSSQIL